MVESQIYPDGARIEAWRPHRGEWVPGTVHGYEQRDGVWKYFVQLSDYGAAQENDPTCWYLAHELRPARDDDDLGYL